MFPISEMIVMIENQPNNSVEAPAKNTAKKLRFLNERKIPIKDKIATNKKMIANTIFYDPP